MIGIELDIEVDEEDTGVVDVMTTVVGTRSAAAITTSWPTPASSISPMR